jgi:hypothetical protein
MALQARSICFGDAANAEDLSNKHCGAGSFARTISAPFHA